MVFNSLLFLRNLQFLPDTYHPQILTHVHLIKNM